MNPPEQAPALKQIYEARLELVRQNEAEVEDLKYRLEKATRRGKDLVAQMKLAKANYKEAASKIVDLLDEKEGGDEGDSYHVGVGNESKYGRDRSRTTNNTTKRGKSKPEEKCQSINEDVKPRVSLERTNRSAVPSQLMETPSNYVRNMMLNQVVELLDSDDDNAKEGRSKPSKRSRSASSDSSKPQKESSIESKRSKSSSPRDKSDETRRSRSSSTGSAGKPEKSTRKRSSSVTHSNRIKLRPRPSSVPPERWLKSSVGRTRQELNNIDDMVQYMGSCQFGQSVVASKFGKVYAVTLNDEWNTLAQRNDEYQYWYVGLGPGRKRDARLVGASESSIPIFHAPKEEYNTKELFYVGHYRVTNLEELDPPVVQMEKERDMKLTFAFEMFDERLDSIIKRGPDR